MRTLYFDCSMGASGDMIVAALLELLPNPDVFVEKFNALSISSQTLGPVELSYHPGKRCGLSGTSVHMLIKDKSSNQIFEEAADLAPDTHHEHCHEHGHCHEHCHDHDHAHHHGMNPHQIDAIFDSLDIPSDVRRNCKSIFGLIAEAESHAHGCPIEHIHFHEIGHLDAIADVLASCLLMDEIKPERIIAAPICLGFGTVRCAHGIIPVPAPATSFLLKGIPAYQGTIEAEMCTPTGAAILRHFVHEYGPMPTMTMDSTGHGLGTREFPTRPNMLRVMLGTSSKTNVETPRENFVELHVNVDDMTGEQIAFATQMLMNEGARDVWTVPIFMKKGRPAQTIACLVPEIDTQHFVDLLLLHTTTLGVRIFPCRRIVLDRTLQTVQTPLGNVRQKVASNDRLTRKKWEFDDIAEIATRLHLSLEEVMAKLSETDI